MLLNEYWMTIAAGIRTEKYLRNVRATDHDHGVVVTNKEKKK